MTTQIESQNESAVLTFNANFLGRPRLDSKISEAFGLKIERAEEIGNAIDNSSMEWLKSLLDTMRNAKHGDQISIDSVVLMEKQYETMKSLGELTIQEFAWAFYYLGADYMEVISKAKGAADRASRSTSALLRDVLSALSEK